MGTAQRSLPVIAPWHAELVEPGTHHLGVHAVVAAEHERRLAGFVACGDLTQRQRDPRRSHRCRILANTLIDKRDSLGVAVGRVRQHPAVLLDGHLLGRGLGEAEVERSHLVTDGGGYRILIASWRKWR